MKLFQIVLILSSFLTLMLVSCSETSVTNENDVLSDQQEEIENDTIEEAEISIKKPALFVDTIIVGSYQLIVRQIDSTTRIVDFPKPDLAYYRAHNEDTIDRVTQYEDSITFQLGNGETLNLVNVDYVEEEGEFSESVSYQFVNSIDNYWQACAICYEYDFTVLINKENGDTIRTIDPGPISPSKDLIICSNVDLESMFTENGIEIFELTPTSHKKVGFIELIEYGLNDMEWISQNKLKAVKVKVTDDYKYELSNVTIEVIKK